MADYISRDAALAQCKRHNDYTGWSIADGIEAIPAADVEPVRRGRWLDYMCRDWHCSECGEKISKVRNVDGYCYDDKPNYCPNCGTKMDLEEDNHD